MSLEMNKIAAAGLTAGVVAMLSGFVADLLVHSERLEENAYPIEVASSEAPGEAAPVDTGPDPVLPLLASADAASGESLTRACQACHSFEKGGPTKVGPNLYGIVGAAVAHVEDYSYSDAFATKHEEGVEWTYSNLNLFLANPREWAPGTKMSYGGMKKVEDRADLIAYLRQNADEPAPLPSQEEVDAVKAEQTDAAAAEASGEAAAAEGSADANAQGEQAAGEPVDQQGPVQMIAAADPAEGEKVARKCAACHSFDQGGPNKVGPNLYNVVGGPVAHLEDYNYSSAFQELHEAGETWTYDQLWTYLQDPRGTVPGTKMSFAGLEKEDELAAVIAYLRQQSENPPPLEP